MRQSSPGTPAGRVQVNPGPAEGAGAGDAPAPAPTDVQGAAEQPRSLPVAPTSHEFPSQSPQNREQEKNFIKFSTTSRAEPIFSHNAINGTNIYKI